MKNALVVRGPKRETAATGAVSLHKPDRLTAGPLLLVVSPVHGFRACSAEPEARHAKRRARHASRGPEWGF